jgi:hypothetical protein
MGKQQMLDSLDAAFVDQSRHLTEPGTAGITSASTSGLLFAPENREGAMRRGGSRIGRRLMSRRMGRERPSAAGPEPIGRNDPEENERMMMVCERKFV